MGSRTRDLPQLTGLQHAIRELRYQEAARQGIGLLLMPLYAALARPSPVLFVAGAVLVCAGILVRLYASGFIVKNQELATSGPYSLVRHPLYTGNMLLLIGFTAASGLAWAVLLSAAFWWFYYPTAIEYEDRKLRRLFGESCARWQAITPAVVPRGLAMSRGGDWSLRTSLSRNFEPMVIAYTLACFWWTYRAL